MPPNVFLPVFFIELRVQIDIHFDFICFLNKMETFVNNLKCDVEQLYLGAYRNDF